MVTKVRHDIKLTSFNFTDNMYLWKTGWINTNGTLSSYLIVLDQFINYPLQTILDGKEKEQSYNFKYILEEHLFCLRIYKIGQLR